MANNEKGKIDEQGNEFSKQRNETNDQRNETNDQLEQIVEQQVMSMMAHHNSLYDKPEINDKHMDRMTATMTKKQMRIYIKRQREIIDHLTTLNRDEFFAIYECCYCSEIDFYSDVHNHEPTIVRRCEFCHFDFCETHNGGPLEDPKCMVCNEDVDELFICNETSCHQHKRCKTHK